jgi:hypothetical protein
MSYANGGSLGSSAACIGEGTTRPGNSWLFAAGPGAAIAGATGSGIR